MPSDPKNPMFAFLLTSVLIGSGTYALYKYVFGDDDTDEYPIEDENKVDDSDDEEEDDSDGFPISIFWGSQSGTAEGFAFDMAKEAKQYGFKAKAIDLEDYDPEDLQNKKLVIFLVATYGEGEPTDNAQDFYNWMLSQEEDDELKNIEFAVFGLGNSQYEFFNEMGKQFDSNLERLGGTRLIDRGIGDDDVGSIEDQFSEWKEKLWPLLAKKYLGKDLDAIVSKWEPEIECEFVDDEKSELYDVASSIKFPYDEKNFEDLSNMPDKRYFKPMRHKDYHSRIVLGKLIQSYELRKTNAVGSTLHIEFDIQNIDQSKKFNYKTADNLGIISRNDHKIVGDLLKRLNLDGAKVIKIKSKEESSDSLNLPVPKIVTIRNLFLWYLDINGMVPRKLINCFAQYSDDNDEKQALLNLAKEGIKKESYSNILSILMKYKTVSPPLECFIELLKPLQPRLYTISSSNIVSPQKIDMCISLEKEYNKDDTKHPIFEGVMTKYLENAKKDDIFQLYIEPSKFKLPNYKIPVIMIGVGAGLAPFIAFLSEGNHNIKKDSINTADFGEWWLFFGCRHEKSDFIYEKTVKDSLTKNGGCLKELRCAFSRDQKEKVYVQHLIKQETEKLWDLVYNKKARIYVCGGVGMGKAVRNAFSEIFEHYKSQNNNMDGHEFLDKLLHNDTYVQELWG